MKNLFKNTNFITGFPNFFQQERNKFLKTDNYKSEKNKGLYESDLTFKNKLFFNFYI